MTPKTRNRLFNLARILISVALLAWVLSRAGLAQLAAAARAADLRLYLLAVVLAGLTGVPMALRALGGPLSQAGFLLFDLLWLATAALAWTTALARQFGAHRRWMVRNYALTFGAVLVRLLLQGVQQYGLTLEQIYPVAGWLAWGSGLTVAELCLIRGGRPWA